MQQVSIPKDHFKRHAHRDYSDPLWALTREFFQNGSDAGASSVNFDVRDDRLIVANNGTIMTRDVLENVFLTLGMTTKTAGDVGGMARARELLVFSSENWTIRTGNVLVRGEGCYYEVEEVEEFQAGVITDVERPMELSEYHLRRYLQTCQAFATGFVNGEPVGQLPKGRRIRDLGWATLHKALTRNGEKVSSIYLMVRARGITMFKTWVDDIGCELVLELKGDTKQILTSNRDGLNAKYREELEKVVREIQVNRRSALQPRDNISIKTFPGNGLTSVVLPAKEPTAQPLAPTSAAFTRPQNPPQQPLSASVPTSILPPAEDRPNRPDILVFVDHNGTIPKRFLPENWSKKTRVYMALWHKILQQVFLDMEQEATFGIGLVIQEDTEAMKTVSEGQVYFLLNPFAIEHKHLTKPADRWLLMQELKQKACHEIAHFVSNMDHNETFTNTMEGIQRKTWKSERTYRKIAQDRNLCLDGR